MMNRSTLSMELKVVTNTIHITIIIDGKKLVITTRRGEYRNLMALLYDKIYIENFGECKGTGRCGTCHIHVIDPTDRLLQPVGNEVTTLSKMDHVVRNSRLACQLMIDETLDGIQIEVPPD